MCDVLCVTDVEQCFLPWLMGEVEVKLYCSVLYCIALYCIVLTDVEQGFLPWLMGEVEVRLQQAVVSRMLLDDLIRFVVTRRNNLHASSGKLTLSKSLRSGGSKTSSRRGKKGEMIRR